MEEFLVFTGRPNAGKSSIIKEVVGLDVTTGKRPGTTRTITKYPLSDGLVLVDMPGFGRMLGVSKKREREVNDRIIEFLEANAQSVATVIHVLDISTFTEVTRRLEAKGFISVDVEMVQFVARVTEEFPLVAANKIDKKDETDVAINLTAFMDRVNPEREIPVGQCVFPVSAKTGEGLGALKAAMHARLVAKGYRTPFRQR